MAKQIHPFLQPYREALVTMADPDRAIGQAAYMRHQFIFFGIGIPELRKTVKTLLRDHQPSRQHLHSIIRSAWAQPEREFQYVGIWLARASKKDWDDELVGLMEFMITHKSWWDTVDGIASELSGPYFQARPLLARKVTGRWNRADNIWLQRSSLIFLKSWKNDMDRKILEKHIARLSHSGEFFVQKAIGWVLRDLARTDPQWVKQYVQTHRAWLPALSIREALKHL
jgi:3-methyladenine DNA glycosylase AlkD